MGYVAEQKSRLSSDLGLLMPRVKSFAATLTGGEGQAQALARATRNHLLARMEKERGHTPLALWALAQMYKIWVTRFQNKGPEKTDPRLFQPRSRANDGGISARFALNIAQLGPRQRAALHLVYGERLSYDEVAEILAAPVGDIITLLARSHAALADAGKYGEAYRAGRVSGHRTPQSQTAYGRGRAA